jgi:hypothetical protein
MVRAEPVEPQLAQRLPAPALVLTGNAVGDAADLGAKAGEEPKEGRAGDARLTGPVAAA